VAVGADYRWPTRPTSPADPARRSGWATPTVVCPG